jgi:hypothetical protein
VEVVAWTGVVVKGASSEVPLLIQLAEPLGVDERNLAVTVGAVPCRVACTDNMLAATVPVAQLMPGKQDIRIYHEKASNRIELPLTSAKMSEDWRDTALPCSVVDLVAVAYPEEDAAHGQTREIRGNSLAAIAIAEAYPESVQQLPNDPGHYVAIMVTKSHPSDFASVFVFGLKSGKARLDRYETAESNLENRHKWDFIDTCQLGEVVVAAQGDLTIVTLSDGVEFVFEPRTAKQAYAANIHVGPMVFATITNLGDAWITWFSKHWVPAVAVGDPEETGMIERFAAPTISSLTKRSRGSGKYVPHSARPGWTEPMILSPPKGRSVSPGKSQGAYNTNLSRHYPGYSSYSPPPRPSPGPIGPKPHYDEGSRVRKCILSARAPEMAMYNRGEMVESRFPKRIPNLNMSPDVAMALKPDRRPV